MNPSRVKRDHLCHLTDLPNVGAAMARDLESIGITRPEQLVGKDPLELYQRLCDKRGSRQDPCVLDIFISVTRFMNGEKPKAWWRYTGERKRRYGAL